MHPYAIALDPHVTRIRLRLIPAMREFPPETKPAAIELLRRSGIRHMEQRDRQLDQSAPH
jgi:hypothetical protein